MIFRRTSFSSILQTFADSLPRPVTHSNADMLSEVTLSKQVCSSATKAGAYACECLVEKSALQIETIL